MAKTRNAAEPAAHSFSWLTINGSRRNTRERTAVRPAAANRGIHVAVACPYCPIMLRDAANRAQRDDVEILDVAEIVARNLRLKSFEAAPST